ncbi:hypothetical protein ACFL2V_03705 [Pseudomonadota bacterium]
MNYGIRLIAVALYLFANVAAATIPSANAEAISKSSPKISVEQFIKYGGMQEQFEQLPALVRFQLKTNQSNLFSTSRYNTLSELVLDAYGTEGVKTAMSRHLRLSYSAGRYRSLMKRLDSPTLKNLLELEINAFQAPMAKYEYQQFIIHLKKKPEPTNRVALIHELISASGDADLQSHAQFTISNLIKELMTGSLDSITTQPKTKTIVNAKLAESTINKTLFIYRDVSDDEIKQLIRFYQSTWGNWFKQTRTDAWLAALRDIGRDVAWRLDHSSDEELQTAFEEFDI